ncbi:MAG: leucine--tRNA ligase [Xanthomonadaceae bacterium]|nr:leucine--tRNA ligase [Xanthomonadaceae bacterium]
MRYDPNSFEPKWQKKWEDKKLFKTPDSISELQKKPKYYVLDMFPYPSGAGLHIGHPEGYTATDVIARYKRMKGFNVLHPMGWDAFGLPAERAAMRDGIHPAIITKRNVDNFRQQLKRIGFSYDWDREVDTSHIDYYKWTQWIFLKLYEKGLAYLAEVPVNWCPALATVLANEEVKDGKYVETGDIVERKSMKQWMLRITVYAERLLEDLDGVDWPEGVKDMQRNWIGKSIGAEIKFSVKSGGDFTVYTTRPDTLFGATYCVLAPEHSLIDRITTPALKKEVDAYVTKAKQKTDLARTDLAKDKSGVFTGAYAINPANGKELPIYVADYVLMTYGTGAIMAVPGHDERDHEFAVKFKLPIIEVISGGEKPVQEAAHSGDGKLVNSDFLNGLDSEAAKHKMVSFLETKGTAKGKTQYKLRDWLFSRQRYWGEPFPILVSDDGTLHALQPEQLPVELPTVDEYKPTTDGEPPLARAPASWREVKLPDGSIARRETNTMPQWAGSCWYYLRYIDPKNDKQAWSPELEKYWMPVDLYVGGVEHAVLHLLYSRFWHKVLYDCGLVHTKEPFHKLFNQGMILAYSYQDDAGKYYSPEDVELKNEKPFSKTTGKALKSQIEKMSKSKLNVVNPNDVIAEYGADALRLYELFMGPLEQVKPWQTEGCAGVYRFLARVWRLFIDENTGGLTAKLKTMPGSSQPELWKTLHKSIKKVGEDIEALRFNTGISQMMIFINEAYQTETIPLETAKLFLRTLSPYAPHVAEELWEKLGEKELICATDWPVYDAALVVDSTVPIVIQINGKRRDEIQAPKGLSKPDLEKLVMSNESVQKHLGGQTPKKIILVPDRLVNFVV